MDQKPLATKPSAVNKEYFTTETFPEIIGFCEKDPHTHVSLGDEESYEYKMNGKRVYVLKKHSDKWQIIEYLGEQIYKISTDPNLGKVLTQALTYFYSSRDTQESRVNILIPINKKDYEKALAVMYYLGGYPTNFLMVTPELKLIIDRFVDPELTFLSYSYVPVHYIPWLSEELKKVGLIGQEKTRTILMYKK